MKNPLVWVIIAIVLIGGYFAFASLQDAPRSTPQESATTTPSEVGNEDGAPVSAFTVRYTDSGFSPVSLSVPVGTAVTFINQSSEDMWVASNQHPSHTGYDGTSREEHCRPGATPSFDQCGTGSTYSFTFTKAGAWEYHNHRNDDAHGTIVVTP